MMNPTPQDLADEYIETKIELDFHTEDCTYRGCITCNRLDAAVSGV